VSGVADRHQERAIDPSINVGDVDPPIYTYRGQASAAPAAVLGIPALTEIGDRRRPQPVPEEGAGPMAVAPPSSIVAAPTGLTVEQLTENGKGDPIFRAVGSFLGLDDIGQGSQLKIHTQRFDTAGVLTPL
jgi:hypothetical protein